MKVKIYTVFVNSISNFSLIYYANLGKGLILESICMHIPKFIQETSSSWYNGTYEKESQKLHLI